MLDCPFCRADTDGPYCHVCGAELESEFEEWSYHEDYDNEE